MSPVTHLLVSWSVANLLPGATRRQRIGITLAGISADLDGVGAVPDKVTALLDPEHATRYFHEYHHILGHNVLFALAFAVLAGWLAGPALTRGRRLAGVAWVLATFHLHLLCDVIGARGPDGNQWPIPYLLPFSDAWQWAVPWQWPLNAWPNFLITGSAVAVSLWLGVTRGRTVVEVFSRRADAAVALALQRRFGRSAPAALEGDAPAPRRPDAGAVE